MSEGNENQGNDVFVPIYWCNQPRGKSGIADNTAHCCSDLCPFDPTFRSGLRIPSTGQTSSCPLQLIMVVIYRRACLSLPVSTKGSSASPYLTCSPIMILPPPEPDGPAGICDQEVGVIAARKDPTKGGVSRALRGVKMGGNVAIITRP